MLLQNELCPQGNKYYMTTFDSILSVPMAPAQIPMYGRNKKKLCVYVMKQLVVNGTAVKAMLREHIMKFNEKKY